MVMVSHSRAVGNDDFVARLSILEIQQEERLARRRAEILHLPYINLAAFPMEPEALTLVPQAEAQAAHAVLFYKKGRDVRLGAVNPQTAEVAAVAEKIGKKLDLQPQLFVVSNHSLQLALSRYPTHVFVEQPRDVINVAADTLSAFEQTVTGLQQLGKHITSLPPSEILSLIIAGAVKLGASDVHIEPRAEMAQLRYRIDGVLHDITAFDLEGWKQLLSRVKVLAKLKLNVKDLPQDGSFVLRLENATYDVRVSVLPGGSGENIVLRLFGRRTEPLRLPALGMKQRDYAVVLEELKRNTGMLLASGPTGSGKTTTIAACIAEVNKPELKVITIEDPIEYRIPGVEQTQVDTSAGYTFSVGLRSLLRQDPDVIMVGEIRDTETAEVAVHAALTGHLVFSTLHSNDAPSLVTRLIDMGVKPYVLGAALNLVIAQRLVRVVCSSCAERSAPDDTLKERITHVMQGVRRDIFDPSVLNNSSLKILHARGCPKCGGTGYRGRTGIFEIFAVRGEVEELILQAADTNHIRDAALKAGMTTLAQDGYLKVIGGITTVEEIDRVSAE